jgi:hypothetical protein
MCTRNHSGRKNLPAHKVDNLTAICEPIVYKMWEPRRLTDLRASMACYGKSFKFTNYFTKTTVCFDGLMVINIKCLFYR